MKKLLSILLTLVLFLSMSTNAFATEATTEAQKLNNEVAANEQYQLLLDALDENASSSVGRGISVDYYGGAYINDSGNLVVCVTDDYDASSNMIETYTGNEDVIIERVDYTYAALLDEQVRIREQYETLHRNSSELSSSTMSALVSLQGTYINEVNNTLVIEIADITAEKIEEFKNSVSNAAFLEFKEANDATSANETEAFNNSKFAAVGNSSEPAALLATSIRPGSTITTSGGLYVSVGYPVYITLTGGSVVYGFITAGHAFSSGDSVYMNGTQIGTCVRSYFSPYHDAALIQITNSSYTMSAVTAYAGQSLNTSYYNTPAAGTTVYLEGAGYNAVDGHIRSGEIISTSQDSYRWDYEMNTYGFMRTDINAGDGDGGGVVYTSSGIIVGHAAFFDYSLPSAPQTYVYKLTTAVNSLNCNLWN